MKSLFTDLEQSKWLKEFFERHPDIQKPKTNVKWGFFETVKKPCSLMLFITIEDYEEYISISDMSYFKDMGYDGELSAYTLDQLESLLPAEIKLNEKVHLLNTGYYSRESKQRIFWYWICGEGITMGADGKHIDNTFHNIIVLLKVLEKKGVFK